MLKQMIMVAGVLLSPGLLAEQSLSVVKIEITGLDQDHGDVFIAVYDSKDQWLGENTVADKHVDIARSKDGAVVRAELQLQPGRYAFSLFHDVNGNGELDTNFIGMPKEPIALSNNAKARFGPPKFADAVFELGAEPVVQSIDMTRL